MVSMDRKQEASYRGPDLKLFVRDVCDRQRKKRPITVRSWSTIKDVKDVIQQVTQVPPSKQRLYFGPLLTSGGELPNHRTLNDAGIYRSGETLLLDIKGNASPSCLFSSIYSLRSSNMNDVCISSSMMDCTPKRLRSIAQEARRGFAMGLKPEFVLDGSGGTYFLHDVRKNKIAVFKPADEEPYAENNPRGYLPRSTTGNPTMSLREGIAPGEACIREVAAFLIDHFGFSGVPMTTLAEARHPAFNTNGARLKVSEGGAAIGSHSLSPNSPVKPKMMKKAGSLQEFVRCECTMDDISPSKISVDEVHKIAILDIRIMNADRNSANLLVRRHTDDSLELVPIDHGYCLRSVSDVSWMDWCWLDWPQLKKPISDKIKKYVLDLDIEADARLLSERLNICEDAIDYFRASSSLLKAGVKAGLTLYDIAILCCRNDNMGEVPSMLEKLSDMASELATVAIENERWHHTAASRAIVEQLSPRHRRRSSMLAQVSPAGNYLAKSASSGEFLSFRHESSGTASLLSEALAVGRDSPGMAQSSASDSSTSDTADANVEKEECEEWAATLIMDVSMDQIIARRTGRSGSIVSDESSDSALSSTPKGFWYIKPGSSHALGSDDGSVAWSVQDSPRPSVTLVSGGPEVPPLVDLNGSDKSLTVSFGPSNGTPDPPDKVSVTQYKSKDDGGQLPNVPNLLRSDSGMSRSKSYSALSAASVVNKKASLARASHGTSKTFSDDHELYRKYFHKFIDLVIVRETTAALHNNSRHGSNNDLDL